jgi:hypothetical protein
MLQLLVDVAGHESLPRRQDDVGRVRILSAATARTITAKHLFLAGMSEQAFPSPEPPGRLYREADYRTIQRNKDRQTSKRTAGVDEPPDVRRTHEEMLLFYELLTRAEETLTLSYPSLDDKAQQLPPSPYVEEIKRLLGAEKFDSRRSKPRLSPLPPDGPPWSANEWRLQATSRLLAGEPEQLGNLLGHSPTQAVGGAIAAGLRIVAARSGRQEFGWAEGLMNSPAIAARLARRFGPQHDWSPSQFEEYAACPYKFFLHQVLGLEPLGELSLEIDYLRRGSRVHQVLAEFHSRFADNPDAWAELQRDVKRFTAELMRAIDATLGEAPRDGLDAALLELDRRQIEKWASAYQAEYEKYQGRWPEVQPQLLPRYFELRFGPLRKGEAGPEDKDSKGEYFRLDVGGERIKIVGRIDRIDVGGPASRPVFNVIDYKSGHRPKLNRERIESGESMQPALYVMAAEALVFGAGRAMPLWAGYWSLKDGVSTDKRSSLICSADGVTPSDDWLALRQKVSERVGQIVRDVRQGMFPVHNRDEQCTSRCEFRTVCRIGQVRATGKIWPPDTECGELQDDNL